MKITNCSSIKCFLISLLLNPFIFRSEAAEIAFTTNDAIYVERNNNVNRLYSSNGIFFDYFTWPQVINEKYLSVLALSHDSINIKVTEPMPSYARTRLPKKLLMIFKIDGALIDSFENVFSYSWSPDGKEIAFLKGQYLDISGQYRCKEIWLYNVESNDSRHLLTAAENQYIHNIYWASFDNNLYFESAKRIDYETVTRTEHSFLFAVYRFNFSSGKEEITPLKSSNISPDGKFYVKESFEGAQFEMYELDSNNKVDLDLPTEYGFFGFFKWEVNGNSTFVFLYDLEKTNMRIWKLNCNTRKFTLLKSPGIHYKPAGIVNERLVWFNTNMPDDVKSQVIEY